MVGAQTLLQSICIIVGSLDQWLAGHVILHCLSGWIKDLVICASGSRVNEPAGDSGDEEGVIYL